MDNVLKAGISARSEAKSKVLTHVLVNGHDGAHIYITTQLAALLDLIFI